MDEPDPRPPATPRRCAIMSTVAAQPHVTLTGDITGEYVVKDKRPNGEGAPRPR